MSAKDPPSAIGGSLVVNGPTYAKSVIRDSAFFFADRKKDGAGRPNGDTVVTEQVLDHQKLVGLPGFRDDDQMRQTRSYISENIRVFGRADKKLRRWVVPSNYAALYGGGNRNTSKKRRKRTTKKRMTKKRLARTRMTKKRMTRKRMAKKRRTIRK